MYSKGLNYTVKKLPVGCSRIVAIEVLTDPPLCICSVYMPSRNSKSISTDKESYQQCLDQLEEVLDTFSGTHAVLILGNMNASLCKRKGNNQDILLESLLDQMVYAMNKRVPKHFSIRTKLIKQRLTTVSSMTNAKTL